ncbi:MAG: hypothetical protein JW705_09995 [Methanosarcinaceae archaeon]|nr:hypothetical protein [Methanosarcinaceae archaeon]
MTAACNMLPTESCIGVKDKACYEQYPNFCYELNWDTAEREHVDSQVDGIVLGVAGVIGDAVTTGGSLSLPAYCAGDLVVPTTSAWYLADEMAAGKWPSGID